MKRGRRVDRLSPEITYTFELDPRTRGAWKKTKQNMLANWLFEVRIFLRNPDDFVALIHELVESHLAMLIFHKFRWDFTKSSPSDYGKACHIAHLLTELSLPRVRG